jgi:hypothetical protein
MKRVTLFGEAGKGRGTRVILADTVKVRTPGVWDTVFGI